jgi:hypothetical protein
MYGVTLAADVRCRLDSIGYKLITGKLLVSSQL